MGKSGIIGKKIAASLASTGTPSFFMHPAEAFHGDLGMVQPEDIFMAISNSGETEEILKLLPFLKDNKNYIISMTGNINSTLARNSDCVLNISVPEEACPHQLAPTTSTTATLVMGDALTVALMEARNFTPENFARFHPGGALGRKLLSKVNDEMETLPLPHVSKNASFADIVTSISSGKLGFVIVDNNDESKFSIITDGDLRRAMAEYKEKVFSIRAHNIATINPLTIQLSAKTQHAYDLMDEHKVSFLLVLDDNGELISVIRK
jgi:arabinose-5-phosphate isomerase